MGLEIDTVNEIVRLPIEKITKCKKLINEMLTKSKCRLKELQALLGLLNFACAVVPPGRAFLQSMYALTVGVKHKNFFLRVNNRMKKDLKVFLTFLETYNGVSFYREQFFMSENVIDLFTDAAKMLGYGAWFHNYWFSIPWPSEYWKEQNITLLELIPIVLALNTWGGILKNQVVLIHTDNDALHHVINKQYSKEIEVKPWIRELVTVCLSHNILIKASHISGTDNFLADHLSRLEVALFLQKHGSANKEASLPPNLSTYTFQN